MITDETILTGIDRIVTDLRRRFPDALGVAQRMRASRGEGLDWPGWCWLPMAATVAYLTDRGGTAADIAALHAITTWRIDRAVLSLDEAAVGEVLVLAEPVPGEALGPVIPPADRNDPEGWRKVPTAPIRDAAMALPAWCPYIMTPPEPETRALLRGLWVWAEHDVNTGRPELRILVDHDGTVSGLVPYVVYLDRPTLGRAVDDMLATTWATPSGGRDVTGLPDPASNLVGTLIHGALPIALAATRPGYRYTTTEDPGADLTPRADDQKLPTTTTHWTQHPLGLRAL